MRDLTKENPITEKMIKQLKKLRKSDLEYDHAWMFAPIIVTSNKTRHLINRNQVIRFAKFHNRQIFKWIFTQQNTQQSFFQS